MDSLGIGVRPFMNGVLGGQGSDRGNGRGCQRTLANCWGAQVYKRAFREGNKELRI
jgi:hypothetical protein